ncbi:hypothetical protein P692DRAFT_20382947 [Suillus brevipes Sb2]|nr:hypothetical protein P692DRAFT_20382947 [Suillus brevipes Sb2]
MGSDRAKLCDLCDQTIKPRGWSTHRKACEKNTQKRAQDQRIADSIRRQKGAFLNIIIEFCVGTNCSRSC